MEVQKNIKESPMQLFLRQASLAVESKAESWQFEWDEVMGIELLRIDHDMTMPQVIDHVSTGLVGRFFKAYSPALLDYILEKTVTLMEISNANTEEKEQIK